MENVISIALKAEQEAQSIIKEAMTIKAECEESIKNAGLVKDVYLKKAQDEMSKYRAEKETHASLIEQEIASGLERNLEQMDKSFAENGQDWVTALFNKAVETL